MFKKTRRVFRRGAKTRVFWYAPPDAWDGTATTGTAAPGAEVLVPLVTLPRDVPAAGLAAAQEAPHNDTVLVHRVVGQVTANFSPNVAGARQQAGLIRIGLCVLHGSETEGTAVAVASNAAELGGNQLLSSSIFGGKPFLWLDQHSDFAAVDAGGAITYMTPRHTFHIDVRVKRRLKQGETLFLAYDSAAMLNVPLGYFFVRNVRCLLSTAR